MYTADTERFTWLTSSYLCAGCVKCNVHTVNIHLFVCVEVLRPSQPNGVMLSKVNIHLKCIYMIKTVIRPKSLSYLHANIHIYHLCMLKTPVDAENIFISPSKFKYQIYYPYPLKLN